MIKVLIADDHSVVRSGIKQILSDESDMQVAGEACNSQEVIEKISNEKYDVLVLDITMPGKSGLEVSTDVKKNSPRYSYSHPKHAPRRTVCSQGA